MTLSLVGSVGLVVCAVAATAFPILYLRSPWYVSTVGRDAMTFSTAMALILDLSISVRIFGLGGMPRQWLSAGIYLLLAVMLTRRVLVLRQLQTNPDAVARRDEARRVRRAARRGRSR